MQECHSVFVFAALAIISSLLTFGAVLPVSYFALALIWFVATGVVVIWRLLTRGSLDLPLLAAFVACGVGIPLFGPKLALWIIAGCWSWEAARDNRGNTLLFLRIMVGVGVFEALLGLVQYFAAPGWIFGYQNTTGNLVSGSLINRNHFAGLVEMLIPCCIGLGFIAVGKYGSISRGYLHVLAGALMALALAFSLSRMGLFSFLATLLFTSMMLVRRKSHRNLGFGLGAGLLGLVLAGALWIGVDAITEHYAGLIGPDSTVDDARLTIDKNTIAMIRHFPRGVGVAKYVDAFRPFQTTHPELLFDHAHNDYLETTAEWGVPIAVCFWLGILAIFVSLVRLLMMTKSVETEGILLACTGAMFTILVHSLADFNLQIPSNAIIFFSFVGTGMAMLFPKRNRHEVFDR
jgi:O-antigen ligase